MPSHKFSISTRDECEGLEVDVGRTGFASLRSVAPLEAYLSLKSLFGEAAEGIDDDDKTQWTFYLKTDDAQIEVYDYKLETWSITVYEKNTDESRAQELISELEKLIVRASRQHKNQISELRKHPVGHVIENPFALYYETAVQLLEVAEQLSAEREQSIATGTFRIGNWSTPSALCRAAFFQFVASIEGLLNLIYELYLKPELREERIAGRLAREQIDLKLRLLPVYCDCFPGKPLDTTAEAIRNFNRLVNDRNDLIHANVTTSMRQPIIRLDGLTFLLSVEPGKHIIPGSFSDLGLTEIKEIRAIVDELVGHLMASMTPRDRKDLEPLLLQEFIEVAYEDGIPVIQG